MGDNEYNMPGVCFRQLQKTKGEEREIDFLNSGKCG